MALDPRAKFVYVANKGSNNVSAYSIAFKGALTPVLGSPFAAGGGPISAAVDPTAKFAYVANFYSNSVSVYSIGSNGALTPVPGSPFGTRVNPISVAITRLITFSSTLYDTPRIHIEELRSVEEILGKHDPSISRKIRSFDFDRRAIPERG